MKATVSWLPDQLPTSWDPTHGWLLSYLLPLVVVAIAVAYVIVNRSVAASRVSSVVAARIQRALMGLLLASALLAVVNYHDYGLFRYNSYINEWDVYHYYIGAKYAPEVGYADMYSATLIADRETGLKYAPASRELRDLHTARLQNMDVVLSNAEHYKQMFSPARWAAFVHDIAWFKAQLPADRWSELLQDHGYNGTPAWSLVVGRLISHASISDAWSRYYILSLDPLLFIATFACVWWAFGLRTMLLMIIFVGTHYLFSWGHLKGALLRTDFALCVVMAACCVKRGWYKTAGVLLGWSILARVFPVFFLVGPGVKLLFTLIEERRIDRKLLALCLTCGLTLIAVVLTSIVYFDGTLLWQQWIDKISLHYLDMSHWNIGYQPMVDVEEIDGVPQLIQPAQYYHEQPSLLLLHKATTWGVRALVLLPAMYFAKSLRDHEALIYGFVFMFFMVAAAYYYYLILLVPLLFFAPQIEKPSYAAGLAFMFLTGAAGYLLFAGWDPLRDSVVMFRGWKQYFQTYYYLCWMICITALTMVVIAGKRTLAESEQR